ncbi:MAG: hypothetical protein H6505_05420 [Calditrichaeota bacterium]|nr:hypothetical protein [Calditrichota bacterium]
MRALLIFLVLGLATVASASVKVSGFPLTSHSWYDYRERAETNGGRLTGIQPLIVSSWQAPPDTSRPEFIVDGFAVSRPHSAEMGRYMAEWNARKFIARGGLRYEPDHGVKFRPFRTWPALFGTLFEDGFHFYSYANQQEHFAFSVQPVYALEVIETDDERGKISRFTGGFRVEAGYDQRLYGMVDFRDNTESGNGPYDARENLYEDRWAAVDLKGNGSTSYDISESIIQYYGKDLAVSAGRGRHKWGPGSFGGLLLNDYAPPFDYARLDMNFSRVGYTFLHGFLNANLDGDTLYVNPDGRPRTLEAQKYLSAQRIEISTPNNLLVAFSQAVIYGDRGLQLGYLTPLNFLYSVQHSEDDKDNLLLSLDGKWRPVTGLKLYGELLLDDVLVGDLFKGTGNSKNAFTLGAHGILQGHDFWSHFDTRVEYTKVRPFVYSHFFQVNTYSHWTSPLGYTREPNSEFTSLRVGATFFPFYGAVTFRRQIHGANTWAYNYGGSIFEPNYAGNDEDFPFLAGAYRRTDELTFSARYEVLPNLNLLGEISRIECQCGSVRNEWHAGFSWNI